MTAKTFHIIVLMYYYIDTIMAKDRHRAELLEILIRIKDSKILARFLEDILTPQELSEIIRRWQIVKLLVKRIPQRTISRNLGVSIATVTRGARVLRDKKSSFYQILKKKK